MTDARAKLEMILKRKSPFTDEQIAGISDAAGWEWIHANAPTKPVRSGEICFTGFKEAELDELRAIASGCDHLRFVASVTRTLAYLCYGPNAGPKKLEKARAQGAQMLDRGEFERLAADGELPTIVLVAK